MRVHLKPQHASLDGLGVKRWRFHSEDGLYVLSVFERPPASLPFDTHAPYLLRLDCADGRHVATRFATFEGEARDRGEYLLLFAKEIDKPERRDHDGRDRFGRRGDA